MRKIIHFPGENKQTPETGGKYTERLKSISKDLGQIANEFGLEEREVASDLTYMVIAQDIQRIIDREN